MNPRPVNTIRLAAALQRRRAVYLRSRGGRLKVIVYQPWESRIEPSAWKKGETAKSALDRKPSIC